jgi:RHS repeat-associated protein
MTNWDKSENTFGWALTAIDTSKKKTGNASGRIDDGNYPSQWSTYVYSDTWTPINNTEDTYYTVTGWVYVETVSGNSAKLWLVTRKAGETGYPTGHHQTQSNAQGTWQYLKRTVLIPADVRELNIRIENVKSGKVWFDDVKIVKGNTAKTVVVEESNYYPFGLKHKGYNNIVNSNGNSTAQKKGFNGMELNEELGLEWYDYTARNYDPALGRWMNLDPLAEQMRRHSPYNFAFNNPIYFIDPDGMAPVANGEKDDTVVIVDKCEDACDNNTGKPSKNTQRLLNILNKGLDGFSTVEISSKGELVLVPTDKKGKQSERSSKLSSFLGKIFDDENTITLTVSSDSKETLGGNFATGDIDVSDMEKFGDGSLETAAETIVHEFAEQYEKQVNGVTNFNVAHKTANQAEATISGNTKLENRKTGSFIISLPFRTSEGVRFMKMSVNIPKASFTKVKQ